jgi:hypothetical protein
MKRKMRKLQKQQSRESLEYADVLTSIFEFMLASGATKDSILELVQKSLAKAAKSHGKVPANRQAGLLTAALVLDAWHRNRRYIDSNAIPKAIPLLGSAPSVEALIRAERPQMNAGVTAKSLLTMRLVIRAGKNLYRPADRVAVISKLNPLVQQHVARSMSGLLQTIKNNVTRSNTSSRLIERFAEVPDLPSSRRKEFREFTRSQGWAFLKNMNDWLELRRARRNSKRAVRTVTAGVHLHAYIDGTRGREKMSR